MPTDKTPAAGEPLPERPDVTPTTPDAASGRVIADVEAYRGRLRSAGQAYSQLDRSNIFRYEKHFPIFEADLRDRLEKGALPVRMLVIGVGNMQEPMSYLAVAQKLSKETARPLEDFVRMETVDIREKTEMEENMRGTNYYGLGKNRGGLGSAFVSALNATTVPETPNKPKKGLEHAFELSAQSGEYEFVNPIKDYVGAMMDDESRSRFGLPIENAPVEEIYDVVSCNNVLQHMGGSGSYPSPFKNKNLQPEEYARYYAEVEKILRRVKPGGTLFMGTDGDTSRGGGSDGLLKTIPYYAERFEQVGTGVHRRVR